MEVEEATTVEVEQSNILNKIDSSKYACEYCGKEFNNSSNLTRHTKSLHKRNSRGQLMPDTPNEKFSCLFCEKQYSRKQTLNLHITDFHINESKFYYCSECDYKTKQRSNLCRHTRLVHNRNSETSESAENPFKCSECSASFKQQRGLIFHKKRMHTICGNPFFVIKRKCPLCSYVATGKSESDIHSHFEKQHDISIRFEFYYFDSFDQFHVWKKEIERTTVTFFKKRNSFLGLSNSIHLYQCDRSGDSRLQGLEKQRIEAELLTLATDSCKVNGFCPASIKATFKDGIVRVTYIPSHVGHKAVSDHVADQLESEKSEETILEQVKSSMSDSVLNRFNLTYENDLRNIEDSPNLNKESINLSTDSISNPVLKEIDSMDEDLINIETSFDLHEASSEHAYFPDTIESLIKQLKDLESTALLVYKPQGEESLEYDLQHDDFLLIYMSVTQTKILQKWGQDNICIDGPHGLNCHFQLYTLLTVDNLSSEVFPVTFMFTNRQDEHIVKVFFDSVKEVVGLLTTNVFMSNMEESFYSAWLQTMCPARLRIFSTWHVLKEWKSNIFSKIKRRTKRDEINKCLKTLLYEIDVKTFHNLLEETIERLQYDEDLQEFWKYFETHYKTTFRTWAYCYRINEGVNTNMSIENFNRMLKQFYLNGKTTTTLDKTLCAILTLLRDKLFDLIIKITRGKVDVKLKKLRLAHKKSLSFTSEHITKDEDKWKVLSSDLTEIHIVKKIKNCKSCQLQCRDCNSCFHEFVCSCRESTVKNIMCEHVHAVAKLLKTDNGITEPEPHSSVSVNIAPHEEILQEIVDVSQRAITSHEEIQPVFVEYVSTDGLLEEFVEDAMTRDVLEECVEDTMTEDVLEDCVEDIVTEDVLEEPVEDYATEVVLEECVEDTEDVFKERVNNDSSMETFTELDALKIECDSEYRALCAHATTSEQLEYLRNELRRIRTTVETMNLSTPNVLF